MAQWFWTILMVACIVWYSAITLYVAYKGALDIRGMLGRLARENALHPEDTE